MVRNLTNTRVLATWPGRPPHRTSGVRAHTTLTMVVKAHNSVCSVRVGEGSGGLHHSAHRRDDTGNDWKNAGVGPLPRGISIPSPPHTSAPALISDGHEQHCPSGFPQPPPTGGSASRPLSTRHASDRRGKRAPARRAACSAIKHCG